MVGKDRMLLQTVPIKSISGYDRIKPYEDLSLVYPALAMLACGHYSFVSLPFNLAGTTSFQDTRFCG
jgi:hypothetical protein